MFFSNTLKQISRIIQVERIGILENTTITVFELNLHIMNIIILTNNGEEVINCSFKSFKNQFDSNNSNSNPSLKDYFKSLSVLTYKSKGFIRITIPNHRIISFSKGKIVFICLCKTPSSFTLIKFYLEYISNAFFNFMGGNNSALFHGCKLKANEQFQYKLFEVFFLYSLTKKFIRVIKHIICRKEVNTDIAERIKNIYLLQVHNSEVIFDLRKALKKKKIIKYKQMGEIWNTIKQIAGKQKSIAHRVELTSTYPRINFIIKYLTISNGLCIIEIYSSYRLSRDVSSYKELDVNPLFDYEANASWRLCREFDMFIREYFVLTHDSYGKFYNESSTLPYFDSEVLAVIDNCLNMRISFDKLIALLQKKFLLLMNQKNSSNIQAELLIENDKISVSNLNGYNETNVNANSINANQSFLKMETTIMLSEIVHRNGKGNSNQAFYQLNKTINDDLGVQISDITKYNIGFDVDKSLIDNTFFAADNMNIVGSDLAQCLNKEDKEKMRTQSRMSLPFSVPNNNNRYSVASNISPVIFLLKNIQGKLIKYDETNMYFNYEKKKTVQVNLLKEKLSKEKDKEASDLDTNMNNLVLNEYYINIIK